MLFVTVHVGPATLLVGGGLGAHDTYRHGGKGKICFFLFLLTFPIINQEVAKKTQFSLSQTQVCVIEIKICKVMLRSRSRGAEINTPLGAGTENTNYGSGTVPFYQRLEEIV
jgi:hypothetical protein